MYPTLPENDPTTTPNTIHVTAAHFLNMAFQFNSNSWTWILQKSFFTLVSKEKKLPEHKDTNGGWQNYKREEGFWDAYICTFFFLQLDLTLDLLAYSSRIMINSGVVSHFRSDSEGWRAIPAKVLAIL